MAKDKSELTPLMQQYWQVKNAHPDKIILFRMGDFFEMFHDDAVKAAPILNIALTQRNKKSSDHTPMCGVPHHSIAEKINRLLSAGCKIAICDQIEDPKLAKGLVKRAVTRILTPGMVYDPETLNARLPLYIATYLDRSLCLLDATTGELIEYRDVDFHRAKEIARVLTPVEWVSRDADHSLDLKENLSDVIQLLSEGVLLEDHHHLHIKHSAPFHNESPSSAALLLVGYAVSLQGEMILNTLHPVELRSVKEKMALSAQVLRHLEVFETYKGSDDGSLFKAIDETVTSAGARKLKDFLSFPLTSKSEIVARQSFIREWMKYNEVRKEVRSTLSSMGDLPRRLGKLASPSCSPYDLWGLSQSLERGLTTEILVENVSAFSSSISDDEMLQVVEFTNEMRRFYQEGSALNFRSGGFVQKGFSSELDELVNLCENSQAIIYEIEEREKNETGISSLKIRYNQVFGYSIEITHTHKDKVPESRYLRKQTLVQAERYTTEELQEIEKRILSAQSKRVEMELHLFEVMKEKALSLSSLFLRLADRWAEFDLYASFAEMATQRGYCFADVNGTALNIQNARHPVVELLSAHQYVVNPVVLEPGHVLLLTGPNMAGKSTYMRMTALIVLMAQAGLPVPADSMSFSPFDRVFTRIGASDYIAEGLSTFMVEMKEAAEMLKESTKNSLIIMDEIGRGTATYDGMSLAQALLEYIVSSTQATTLFATHYHELTTLPETFDRIHNAHMAVQEQKGGLRFLYSLKSGPAKGSYGVQVAKLAGLPHQVIRRAELILEEKERQARNHGRDQMSLFVRDEVENIFSESHQSNELSKVSPVVDEILSRISTMDINALTPLEALRSLDELKREVSNSLYSVK